jgi:Uma2 family endonuclease
MSHPLAYARPVSEEEFLSLPESMERIELVDGEVIMSPSPTPDHQVILGELHIRLRAWADRNPPAFVGLSPFDVRIAPGRIVQPDLFVLRRGLPSWAQPLQAVPELVVEVLSSRVNYDRLAKRLLYAEAGVLEYWIVDPATREVEVVQGLATVARAKDRVVSVVLLGLEVDLAGVFPR